MVDRNFKQLALATTAAAGLLVGTAGSSVAQIDEIIVTATKRTENIQDVPLSLSTLSDEKLAVLSSGGADIRFLRARVPSLNIESSFGRAFPRFYIRGLGNTDFDLNSSQPVSLVYDGVVLENPILKGFPAFDLERIEVLRGPQGTLFGRNTPAGIVKFDSKRPSEELDGYGRISYGRFNSVDVEGAVGGPITDTFMGRISALYQYRNDWVDNNNSANPVSDDLEGFNEFAGRAQFLFQPTDRFHALLNLHTRQLDGTARLFRANVLGPDGLNSNFTSRDETFSDGENFQDVEEFGGVFEVEYDAGPVTLTSITGYEQVKIFTKGDIDGGSIADGPGFIPFPAETQDNIPDHSQITQEIRLSTNDWERFNFQIGGFFFSEDLEIETLDFGGSPTPGARSTQSQDTTAWAVFASTNINLTDQWEVAGGVRYSSDEKEYENERPFDVRGFLGGTIPVVTAEVDDEYVSWDASSTYYFTDNINAYVRVGSASRAPSIQGRNAFFFFTGTNAADSVSVADTETVISYEGGVKTTLFNGLARLNVAGFYWDADDLQLTAVGGGANFNRLINAESATGWGFEADFEAAPVERVLLTAGLSYNNTELKDSDLTTAICASGCTVLDPQPVAGFANIDGNSLPQAPEWIANMTFRYGHPVPIGGEVFLYTDWAYRSEVNFFLYESAEFRDDSMIEGGLRVGYLSEDEKYELAAFGRNITNDESAVGGIDFNNLTGFVNEPPFWGVELKAKLN